MNDLGNEGWELVAIDHGEGTGARPTYVFKRPKLVGVAAGGFGGPGGGGGFGGVMGPVGGMGGFGGGGVGVAAATPANIDALVDAAFRRSDRDGDGKLSKDEVPDRVRNEFERFDTNKDGFIDRDEYRKYAESRMGPRPVTVEGTVGQGGSVAVTGGAANTVAAAAAPATAVIPLKHARAEDLGQTLNTVLGTWRSNRGFAPPAASEPRIAADTRTNSLIVLGDAATLKMVKELVEQLDVPAADKAMGKGARP
jgi:hypothetical protein